MGVEGGRGEVGCEIQHPSASSALRAVFLRALSRQCPQATRHTSSLAGREERKVEGEGGVGGHRVQINA